MAKRANGEGTEPRKRKTKTGNVFWQSDYTVYVDGKPKRRSVYAKSKAECSRKLREALTERDGGLVVDSKNLTVGQFFEAWLRDAVKGTVRANTYDDYRKSAYNHIIPDLGHMRMDRLNARHIQSFYARKLASGLSPESVLHLHRALRRGLNQAVKWKLIRENPVLDTEPPKKQKRPATVLSAQQVLRFIETSGTRRLFPLYILDALTAFRAGEILGLAWDDLSRDADGPRVTLRRQLLATSEGVGLVPWTKTDAGRVVRLPALAEAVLKIHHRRQMEERNKAGSKWEDHGLIFTTKTGRWIHPSNVSAYLGRDLELAGLPRIRFHDLRHSLATIMALDGAHVVVIAGMLGHASPTTTLSNYVHQVPGMQSLAVKRLDELFPASLVRDLEALPDLAVDSPKTEV